MSQNRTVDASRLLNQLSRHQLQQILENHGYAVYDKEPAEALLEAVRQDVESGEVAISEVEMHLDSGSSPPSR